MKLLEDQAINELEKALLTRCRDAIKGVDPSAAVILYGSRARGDAGPESDYDLLVLTDAEATLEREDVFRRKIYPIELDTGAVLTVLLVSRNNWGSPIYDAMPLYQNIRKQGIVL